MIGYFINWANGEEAINIEERESPTVNDDELLVRMRAAGINRGEFIKGAGLHAGRDGRIRIGNEVAGEIIAIGSNVTKFNVGDRVMGRCKEGYAEEVAIHELDAMAVPEEMTWVEAAAVPIGYMLAYDMIIRIGEVKEDECIVIAGASSSVGVAALSVAKGLNIKTVGITRSENKAEKLKKLGMNYVVINGEEEFHNQVLKNVTRERIKLAINVVGGSASASCLECLGMEGKLIVVGYVDGKNRTEVDWGLIHARRLHIVGVSNKMQDPTARHVYVKGFTNYILPLMRNGKIKPVIDRVFNFDELGTAVDYLRGNRHVGKIVVRGIA